MARRTRHDLPDLTFDDRLDLFVDLADTLRTSRVIQDGFGPAFSLRANETGMSFTLKEPDEEAFRSFLLGVRPFLSEAEPVFLYAMHNLLHRLVTDEKIRQYLAGARKAWKQAEKADAIHFVLDGHEMQPLEVADLWINAGYFHPGDLKRRKWLQQLQPPVRAYLRYTFLCYIREATQQVIYLRSIILYAREHGILREEIDG